ncbi:MAG: hypothetical protein M3Z04_18720 [Chloroflexota bacterium]|nr:hypothetical protein [Chloroflexota bacterium]
MAEMIEVKPEHTLPELLALIAARHAADPTLPVILAVPRGIALLRQMESYQTFKEATKHNDLRLQILSPDARVVGLALVFGIDAETVAAPPVSGLGTRPLVELSTRLAVAPPVIPPPATAPVPVAPPVESPVAAPLRAEATASTGPLAEDQLSETDWLFGGDVDLEGILRDTAAPDTRSATPPPDVALSGSFPPGLARPAALRPPPAPLVPAVIADPPTPTDDLTWLTSGVDLAALAGGSLNPNAVPAAADNLIPPPALPRPTAPELLPDLPVAPTPLDLADEFSNVVAFDPFAPELGTVAPFVLPGGAGPSDSGGSLGDLLLGDDVEEDAPAMSFSEWLALQKSSVAERTGLPAASDVDLSNLPSWLHPLPAADAPPVSPVPALAAAPAPPEPPSSPVAAPVPPFAPKGTLLCPHCGEALDPEEMLRLLAQVWGT